MPVRAHVGRSDAIGDPATPGAVALGTGWAHPGAMSDSQRAGLTGREVAEAVDGRYWRMSSGRLGAFYRSPDYATGAAFVARVAQAADAANHHPDLTLRYGDVSVTTYSHDVGGLTDRDVALAATVAAIADELGMVPDPDLVPDDPA